MDRMWWQDCFRGVAAGAPDNPVAEESRHIERCPFCGRTFDVRDLGQVLEHYDHQLAARAPPAIDLMPDGDLTGHLRKVVPFRRRREG
jgi:hypothetical protein